MAKRVVAELDRIFAPKSVAVIGASKTPFKWGAQIIRRLHSSGYDGAVYPINPTENEIQGLAAFPSVTDVPDEIDLAIITVPAGAITGAMKECVQKGIKGAIIISADFAETGDHGKDLQDEVVEIARQGHMRVVGPNCFGLWNSASNLNTLPVVPQKGRIGLISQSGSLCHFMASGASEKGYGMSKIISVGNQADLDVADYLEYLADDPDTKAIIIYLEGFSDGRKLFNVARAMGGKKPVIVYKVGQNKAMARVAMSHTAAIIGEDRIFEAMCRQVGFIRAPDLYTCLDMAGVATCQPLPKGNRVGIQGSGGVCVILADACLSMGMEVPELREEDIPFILSGMDFPPHAPVPRNPVDFAGTHTALMEAMVLNKMAQLDYIDGIITPRPIVANVAAGDPAEQQRTDAEVGELLAAIPREYGKPVVLVGLGLSRSKVFPTSEVLTQVLRAANIPSFETPEEAARAMSTLMKYADIRRHFNEQ